MQIALVLTETMSASVTEIAKQSGTDPYALCLLFIQDGINSYATATEIEELKQTIYAES